MGSSISGITAEIFLQHLGTIPHKIPPGFNTHNLLRVICV